MPRFFNITGPCFESQHYMLDAQERLGGLPDLVDRGAYFVIHAPRQCGKTTLVQDLARDLQASGDYHCLYVSVETAKGFTDPAIGIRSILDSIADRWDYHEAAATYPFEWEDLLERFDSALKKAIARFCSKLDRPLVLLIDEADGLAEQTLISFLTQLRDGYVNRGMTPFAHSVALVGMRNLRDYKAKVRPESDTLGSTSPFNIIEESLTLRNFNLEEVQRLYAQHTEETGQIFEPAVAEKVWHWTRGQPWLVNAFARQMVFKELKNDHSQTVTADMVDEAVEALILRRDTHIDSLLERLKEPRVQRIIEPVLLGKVDAFDPADNDYQYVRDLGLVRKDEEDVVPANPLYAEVIARTLSARSQFALEGSSYPYKTSRYEQDDGSLDMRLLLEDFQDFWRDNSEIWVEKYQYKEAAPHLILMAFLQRIVNGGGQINREFASGRGRIDLCVLWKGFRYGLELKIRYGEKTIPTGKKQLRAYLDRFGLDEGWLLVFDRRKSVDWNEKIFWREEEEDGVRIHVVGA